MKIKSQTIELPEKNIPYLDGWRGLAIAGVFLCHFGPRPAVLWAGDWGVQLFFVLSGYLMSHLLFIKKVALSDFFARRFSRVIPTFWFFIVVMILYSHLQPSPYAVGLGEILSTLAFLRTYFPVDIDIWARNWPIGHMWSLNVEEHSYIYLAIGAVLIRGVKGRYSAPAFLLISAGILLSLNFYYPLHQPSGASPWYLRSETAALGLISAAALRVLVHNTSLQWIREPSPFLPVLTFLVALACFTTYSHKGVQYTVAPLCLAFSINFLHQTPAVFRRILSFAFLRRLGVCSFSLYLWQQPFYYAVLNYGWPKPTAFLGALIVGAASFYFFENPLRERLNRAWAARRQGQGEIIATAAPR